jgi:hypothetical protein
MPYTDMAGDPIDAGRKRLGGLVCTVLILDCIPCLLRLYVCIFVVATSVVDFGNVSHVTVVFLLAGTAVSALSGNVLILVKNRWVGIPLAVTGLVLSAVTWGFWWHLRFERVSSSPSGTPPRGMWLPDLNPIEALLISFWAGWLILYGIVLWNAAKKLRWLRGNVNSGRHGP